MPLAFAIGFVALVVAEVYAFVAVAHVTSVVVAVLLLLATSIVGGSLVRREGARAWMRAARASREGGRPGTDIADTGLIVLAGVLLAIPGFITDAAGLLLVLPPTRRLARKLFGFVMFRRFAKMLGLRPSRRTRRMGDSQDPSVIDGEVVNRRRRGPAQPPRIED